MTDMSIEHIHQQAMKGDAEALFQLGSAHEKGGKVDYSLEKALAYYDLAGHLGRDGAWAASARLRANPNMTAEALARVGGLFEKLKQEVSDNLHAQEMRRAADSSTIELDGHTLSRQHLEAGKESYPHLVFTYRVHDATIPSQSRPQQWTLTQYVVHRRDREDLEEVRKKAAHLLQRKLRRLADQLDPEMPCGSCSILAAKRKKLR